MTIWGEDANGQLCRDPTRPEQYNKIIGPHTYGGKLEKGNGVQLATTCHKHHMIPMNTWKRAPQTKGEKRQKTNKPLTKLQEIELARNKLITWTSPDGKTKRQIDYLMVNQKYRNAIHKTNIIPGWQSNMMQQQQHGVIQMNICLKLMRKYKRIQHRETGNQIKYDIQELRQDPQKIARWIKQRESPPEWQTQDNANTMWAKLKKTIHQGLIQCYPCDKKMKKQHRNGQKKQNNGARRKNGKSSKNTKQTERNYRAK